MAQPAPGTENKEISLRDLLITIREWWRYLLSKWIVIGVVGIIGAGLGLTYSLTNKPAYVGELTFVLEDSKGSGGLAAYAGIASQLGIDLGGGGSSMGVFSGDNIMEFLKSRLMIQNVLLSPVKVDNKSISLAELYIDMYHLREKWKDRPELIGLHFPVNSNRAGFSLKQDSILMDIQERIVKKNLEISKPDKKLSFISVKVVSPNEIFSKVFTETLVAVVTDFYIVTKTKRSKVNVDKLQITADSIERILNKKTYSIAAAQDINVNPVKQVASVSTELQSRDKVVLQTMYTEVIKNLELSKITMMQETPLIQIVDTPMLPLKKKRVGKLTGLVVGGILATFLFVLGLIAKKLYKDILNE
jgi:hypothetical protein